MEPLSPVFDARAFFARVRQVREMSDQPARQIALIAGLPHGTVSQLEREEHLPTVATVHALCWACGIGATWLLTGEGKEPTADAVRKALAKARRFRARQQAQLAA